MPTSKNSQVDTALAKAEKLAAKYEWMKAAEIYAHITELLRNKRDHAQKAKISELLANSYFKAAFQSANREGFKQRVQWAESSYENASEFWNKAGSNGLSRRSKARSLFATFWLIDSPAEKRDTIQKCVTLVKEANEALLNQQSKELKEARRDALQYISESVPLAADQKTLREICLRGIKLTEDSLIEEAELDFDECLLETYFYGWIIKRIFARYVLEPSKAREALMDIAKLGERIIELAGKLGTPYAHSLSRGIAAGIAENIDGDEAKALEITKHAQTAADLTKDSLLIGRISYFAAYYAFWLTFLEENLERRRDLIENAFKDSLKAIKNLRISLDKQFLVSSYEWFSECHWAYSTLIEVVAEKKKAHLTQAIDIAREGMPYNDFNLMDDVGHALSKSLYALATLSTKPKEKEQLLKEALHIRQQTVRRLAQLSPRGWNMGVMYNYLALIKSELSTLEANPELKIDLLKGAQSDKEQCVEICSNWTSLPANMQVLATYLEGYGDILMQLHQLTFDGRNAQSAIKAYQTAIEHFTKTTREGSIPALRWKIAKAYAKLSDHKQASRTFRTASEDYRRIARRLLGTAQLFQELASYMDAWVEIEEARLEHDEQDYSAAADRYTEASSILRTTKTWNNLATHYIACSFLEKAEASSQQDRQDAAIEEFSSAITTFQMAKNELEFTVRRDTELDEEGRKEWMSISQGRERYCMARRELEEAEQLDKKGERRASSKKYHSASELFSSLSMESQTKEEQRELETLKLFCDAWAKMKEAEAGASPELYMEAAGIFIQIKDTAKGRIRLLAMANSSLCNALESGVRFRGTQDTRLYSEMKKQLQSAESHYQEGGFENSANWTQATQRLFDALAYLADAEIEREPKRKAELYHLAEKHLELAGKLYRRAGYPAKGAEALKQLQKIRDEKAVLLTPLEALAQNPALSGSSVAPVSLVRDQASGVEKFESANIVGNLSLPYKEVNIGTELAIELEIANVGKTAATLIKLENLVPNGFEMNREKLSHHMDDGHINMKGKRLEYLKTDEVKIALRAMRKGSFELKPRILFVDEKGNYRSYDFEPKEVTVKELGISGWIKGSSK